MYLRIDSELTVKKFGVGDPNLTLLLTLEKLISYLVGYKV